VSLDELPHFIARRMRKVDLEAVGRWAGHSGFTPGSAVTVSRTRPDASSPLASRCRGHHNRRAQNGQLPNRM